MITRLRYLSIF